MQAQTNKSTQNAALFVASFASFVSPFMGSAVNIALPDIGKELNGNVITLSWVAMGLLLSSAVFLVPFGRLADIIGRKKIFNLGLVIFTIGTILCPVSPTILFLIGARIIQGIGSAMIFGTAIAIISSVFDKGAKGKAMGIVISSVYLGLTVGPFAGGVLTKNFGWEYIFWISVPLAILSIVISLINLKGDWAEAKGEKFDYIGSIIYGISISAFMYGLSSLPETDGILFSIIGFIGLIIFIRYELKEEFPVLNVRLFAENRTFGFSNYAALINYSATFGISFLLSLYLQNIKGYDAQQAGLILVSQPLLMAIFSPFAGKMSDKYDPRVIASVGMAMIAIGLYILIPLGKDSSIWFIIPILILFGIGYALFSSPNTNAIMSSVDKRYYGLASGTLGTMRLVGQVSSMGIATLVMALLVGNEKITTANELAFVNSMKICFIVFAVLCSVGIIFSLARGKR